MLTKLLPSRAEDGFTLLELLIVVVIIGVLAAIALPVFLSNQAAAYDASAQSDVRNTVGQVVGWNALNRGTPALSAEGYVAAGGKLVVSPHSYVGLAVQEDGSYRVCGYNTKGNKYSAYNKAWAFDSATGKSGASTAECVNAYHVRDSSTDAGGDSAGSDTSLLTTVPGANGGGDTILVRDPNGKYTTGTSTPVTPDPYANDPTQETVTAHATKFTYGTDPDYGPSYGLTLDTGLTEVAKDNPTLHSTEVAYFEGQNVGLARSSSKEQWEVTYYGKDGTIFNEARRACAYTAEYYSKARLQAWGYNVNHAAYRFTFNCSGRFTDANGNLISADGVNHVLHGGLNGGYMSARYIYGDGSLGAPVIVHIDADLVNG